MVGFHRVGDWGQPRLGFSPVIGFHPIGGSAEARLLSFSFLVLSFSRVRDVRHNLICEEINWTGPNVHLLFIILHHFELGKHK